MGEIQKLTEDLKKRRAREEGDRPSGNVAYCGSCWCLCGLLFLLFC